MGTQDAKMELKEISHLLSHLQGAVTTLSNRLDGLGRALHRYSGRPWGAILVATDSEGDQNSTVDDQAVAGVKRLLTEFASARKIYGTDEQGRLSVLMQASGPEILGAAELVRRRMARMPRRVRPENPDGIAGGEVLIPRTVSIGVAVGDEGPSDHGKLLDAAEKALEEAQTGGKNQVRVA